MKYSEVLADVFEEVKGHALLRGVQGAGLFRHLLTSVCFSPNSWFSRCVFQDRGQELVDGLKVCLQGQSPAMPSGLGSGGLTELSRSEVIENMPRIWQARPIRVCGFVRARAAFLQPPCGPGTAATSTCPAVSSCTETAWATAS